MLENNTSSRNRIRKCDKFCISFNKPMSCLRDPAQPGQTQPDSLQTRFSHTICRLSLQPKYTKFVTGLMYFRTPRQTGCRKSGNWRVIKQSQNSGLNGSPKIYFETFKSHRQLRKVLKMWNLLSTKLDCKLGLDESTRTGGIWAIAIISTYYLEVPLNEWLMAWKLYEQNQYFWQINCGKNAKERLANCTLLCHTHRRNEMCEHKTWQRQHGEFFSINKMHFTLRVKRRWTYRPNRQEFATTNRSVRQWDRSRTYRTRQRGCIGTELRKSFGGWPWRLRLRTPS